MEGVVILSGRKFESLRTFYRNKKVFITGNTGFKGSWLCEVLLGMGANVFGYAQSPPTTPSLHEILHHDEIFPTVTGDIRDLSLLQKTINNYRPDIVIHLAAQPIVLLSYENPAYTYSVNVMGTVNVLEAVRNAGSVRSFLNVTTDKVYRNNEWDWGYRETDVLDGFDPYSKRSVAS